MSDRRQLISSLLDRFPVASQPQLVSLLADQGVHVTQATVSRDLERLGAERVRDALVLVRSMEPSGNLAVLKTAPANAMPVARAFDVADLPEVAGTVAGDDVVLVVAREPCSGADILELCDRIGAEAAHAHA